MTAWPRRLGWTALAVGVGATALFVPPLVLPDGRGGLPDGRGVVPDGRSDPPAAAASTPPPAPSSALPRTAAPASPTGKPSPAAGFAAITLHAADPANLRSGARVIECPTCVGGSRVGYIGGPNTLAIRVAGVTTAGERTMTVTYETAETRTLRVAVGDGPAQALTLSGARDWLIPATVSIRVQLPTGTSWIRFFNDEGPAPDVNQIQLR
ncbi:hypothetical protein ACFPIJ_27805 [Dactylosporangium cerinum]|uniref:CBM6 domain-containing protein n=1 Tax=Dactylosporangium cerinum TaxID=1434730 RepID=A0ABV9W1V9_9ACTN